MAKVMAPRIIGAQKQIRSIVISSSLRGDAPGLGDYMLPKDFPGAWERSTQLNRFPNRRRRFVSLCVFNQFFVLLVFPVDCVFQFQEQLGFAFDQALEFHQFDAQQLLARVWLDVITSVIKSYDISSKEFVRYLFKDGVIAAKILAKLFQVCCVIHTPFFRV